MYSKFHFLFIFPTPNPRLNTNPIITAITITVTIPAKNAAAIFYLPPSIESPKRKLLPAGTTTTLISGDSELTTVY